MSRVCSAAQRKRAQERCVRAEATAASATVEAMAGDVSDDGCAAAQSGVVEQRRHERWYFSLVSISFYCFYYSFAYLLSLVNCYYSELR